MNDSLLEQQLDEYCLESLLGQGGMARVYRALDVRLNRYAAVKVIDTPFRTESDYMLRFEREAQAIAQLEHPHIVSLYRYGEVDGLLYIAMQYIEGSDLSSVLTSYQQGLEFIEAKDARRIIREICLALDYAHSKGVVHRDIKPANIMLDKQGAVFLTDFGLALISEIGTRGEIFGSPHYISPEQAISSAGAVPQSDLYAVGVILYEMFTNQLPFDAADPLDVAMLHMTEPVPSPREACPEISPELEAVILKALDKEPQARYSSGAELADALDQALQATPAKASSPLSLASPSQTIFERVAIELAEHPLPPIPAVVMLPDPQPIKQKKVSQASTALPTNNRRAIYLMGAGAGITLIITLCLLTAVFLLTRGRTADRDPATRATLFETKISQASPEPIKGQTSQSPTEPTVEQTSQAPAAPTVQYPEGRHFVVYYDDNSLYLLNNSASDSTVTPLAFERLDASGVPLNRFDGWHWARYYSTVMPGRCMRAEISGSASFLRPPQCNNLYNSRISATRSDDFIFWTAREGSYQFRVLWNEREVTRCEIAAGVCDVFLPDE